MDQILILVFQLIVLLFSVIIHEVSHGVAANYLGDSTAKDSGRLTLNPIKHLDPFGSFLLPLALFLIKSPVLFGWAKPVPFNLQYLKNPRRDSGLIGLAGPFSNFSIAIIFSFLAKILGMIGLVNPPFFIFIDIIILINIALGIFNLLPIPPLDGSKVLFMFLPRSMGNIEMILERYGMIILLFFVFLGFQIIAPLIVFFYNLLGSGVLF